MEKASLHTEKPNVALFATCLVDAMRPSVGFASVKLIERAGCRVDVPVQSCCGQPAFNAGDVKAAKPTAKNTITALQGYDYVVVPSGSCAGMIIKHYPELFADDPDWLDRAHMLAKKTFELSVFLTKVCPLPDIDVSFHNTVTWHDSCSCLREMKVYDEPRQLMSRVQGLKWVENGHHESCCGFGGLFSVKYGDVSAKIASEKTSAIKATEADVLLGADLGCLINIAGKLDHEGATIAVRHFSEVLSGEMDSPPIGKPAG